ncbi:DUF2292 domain-containing protein [Candidatus Gottesmanbacteria bacterium]|nr:DUF2292 domain-containing protein [Candidatus Gottesmanbacteria bacterium]
MQTPQKLSTTLINELEVALQMIKAYGSIEIYVQDSKVTQITVRNIRKTRVDLIRESKKSVKRS